MNATKKLNSIVERKKSMLCIGLDIDPRKVPDSIEKNTTGLARFALRIIDATSDIVAAYKPNLGFYEALGPDGLSLLKLITSRIPDDTLIIIDGKRGDIGHTAEFYAQAMINIYRADWTTVNPYMGFDSVRPFIEDREKGAFVLCLTSNPGAMDFQRQEISGQSLYLRVAGKVADWNKENNLGLVVGATYPEQMKEIRRTAQDMPLLIPGVGAQGGDLEKAVQGGTADFTRPAIINVSRTVLYASNGDDFDQAARNMARKINTDIDQVRRTAKKQ